VHLVYSFLDTVSHLRCAQASHVLNGCAHAAASWPPSVVLIHFQTTTHDRLSYMRPRSLTLVCRCPRAPDAEQPPEFDPNIGTYPHYSEDQQGEDAEGRTRLPPLLSFARDMGSTLTSLEVGAPLAVTPADLATLARLRLLRRLRFGMSNCSAARAALHALPELDLPDLDSPPQMGAVEPLEVYARRGKPFAELSLAHMTQYPNPFVHVEVRVRSFHCVVLWRISSSLPVLAGRMRSACTCARATFGTTARATSCCSAGRGRSTCA
jgi:hypothetical protein